MANAAGVAGEHRCCDGGHRVVVGRFHLHLLQTAQRHRVRDGCSDCDPEDSRRRDFP
jgi:hypothetical protein